MIARAQENGGGAMVGFPQQRYSAHMRNSDWALQATNHCRQTLLTAGLVSDVDKRFYGSNTIARYWQHSSMSLALGLHEWHALLQ